MINIGAYCRLMRWDKPVGAWLLLWPTLWGLCFASRAHPHWSLLGIFIAGVWLMRSAGCVINDYWDRDIDPQVSRTRTRPLAARELTPKAALFLFGVLLVLSAFLLFFLPPVSWLYALGAVLLTVLYPLMKRVINAPQCVLGIAFSWGLPMAVVAQGGSLTAPIWFLWGLAWLWPVAYDTQYALADESDDRCIGVRSTAISWGRRAVGITLSLQMLLLFGWLLLAWWQQWHHFFLVGWLAAFMVLVKQVFWMRQKTPASYMRAFRSNQWLGFFLLLSMWLGFL